jgi:hypothetical protein
MIIPEDLLDRLLGPDRHVYQSLCPDACNGLASRDPECPHCADLIMVDVLRAVATKPPGQVAPDDPLAIALVIFIAERDRLLAELDAERAEIKQLRDEPPPVYELAYVDWEEYDPRLFHPPVGTSPPTGAEWAALCDGLLNPAVERLLVHPVEWKSRYIGWDTITQSVAVLLVDRGWRRIKPAKAMYAGTGIIQSEGEARNGGTCGGPDYPVSPELRARIIAYNAEVEKAVQRELAEDERRERLNGGGGAGDGEATA